MSCAESRGDHAVLNGGDGGQHAELAKGMASLLTKSVKLSIKLFFGVSLISLSFSKLS